jgi:hypothetical protein
MVVAVVVVPLYLVRVVHFVVQALYIVVVAVVVSVVV